jgi:hypothetical protein
LVLQACKVNKGRSDPKELKDLKDPKGLKDRLALTVWYRDLKACRARLGRKANKGRSDPKDQLALTVSCRDPKACRARLVLQACKVNKGRSDPKDHQALTVSYRDPKASRGRLALQACKVNKGRSDPKACRGRSDPKDLKVRPECLYSARLTEISSLRERYRFRIQRVSSVSTACLRKSLLNLSNELFVELNLPERGQRHSGQEVVTRRRADV